MWGRSETNLHTATAAGAEHQVVEIGNRVRVVALAAAAGARGVGVDGGSRNQVVESDEPIDVGPYSALALLRAHAAVQQEDTVRGLDRNAEIGNAAQRHIPRFAAVPE